MQTKLFELRDEGTLIPVLCVRLESTNAAEHYLLAHTGYGQAPWDHTKYVLMIGLAGGNGAMTSDPYDWAGNRTRTICHRYIIEHWSELESGDVVDYEFITGASDKPKVPQRLDSSV